MQVEKAIQNAFPGNDPVVRDTRVALIQLTHMIERIEWSLQAIASQLQFMADSPMEAIFDGILIEEAELLAARQEALAMEVRSTARKLDLLRHEHYSR